MRKLISGLVMAVFASMSVGAFAMSHGGGMTDKEKMEKMEACKKMDEKKADDKMKAECKKLMEKKS